MVALTVSLTGTGTLSALRVNTVIPPELRIAVLDTVVERAPTSVQVVLTEGKPLTNVEFEIDGFPVLTTPTDSTGEIGPTALEVDKTIGTVGVHTVTASQTGSLSATATFRVLRDPDKGPRIVVSDTRAVEIPDAIIHGQRHWVLQDLLPGGLGSYVLPINPASMTSPVVRRTLTATHTTARDGQYHITEAGDAPLEWSFRGYCSTKEMHDQLLAYGALRRRFYIIDHRNRAWKVAIRNVELVARRRQLGLDRLPTDWGHDYTVTALVYDPNWTVPE